MKYKNLFLFFIITFLFFGYLKVSENLSVIDNIKHNDTHETLSKKEAFDLILDSKEVKYILETGGTDPYPELVEETHYGKQLILDKRINTKEKILKLLNTVYTDDFSNFVYARIGFEEIDGNMYMPCSDTGSIVIWEATEIQQIKIKDNNEEAIAIIKIPLGHSLDKIVSYEILEEPFLFEKGKGWRLKNLGKKIGDIENS